jgi:hypothetical protein
MSFDESAQSYYRNNIIGILLCAEKYTSGESEVTGLYLSNGSLDCCTHGFYLYQLSQMAIQPLLK